MRRLLIKKAIISGVFATTSILFELIAFAFMHLGTIPTFWGIDVAFILGLSVLIFILPSSIWSIVIASILLTGQAVISFINEVLHRMSGMVFGFNMLNLAKEVGGVMEFSFINWWMGVVLVILLSAAIAGIIIAEKKIDTHGVRFTKTSIIVLLVCCIVGENAALFCYQTTIGKFKKALVTDELYYYNDDLDLYNKQYEWARTKALRKFGYFGFYYMNLSNSIESIFKNYSPTEKQLSVNELDKYFSKGQMSEEVYGSNLYTGSVAGKNIVLIVIESGEWYAINSQYTPTLYTLAKNGISFSEYYARDKTNHSEAMSILGSYPTENDPATKLKRNTMSFTLPSLLTAAGYTANYFHANEGDFYKRDTTHTNGGTYGFDNGYFLEDMELLDGCTNGKVTKKDFYEFDKDSKISEYYFDEYTKVNSDDRAFFTMQMTISSHGNYEDLKMYGDYPFSYVSDLTERERLQNEYSSKCQVKDFEKYYNLIDSYPDTDSYVLNDKGIALSAEDMEAALNPENDGTLLRTTYLRYKRYQAGLMDLDEEVNQLMATLKEKGELDDTLFFMYADHTAYYDNQNYYLKGIELGNVFDTTLYNVPCFLWYGGSMNASISTEKAQSMPNAYNGKPYYAINFTATKDTSNVLQGDKVVDKFVTSFDVLPTLLQLAGYDYNLNLYYGASMFSDVINVFVSRESGIFTNEIYYDTMTIYEKDDTGNWQEHDYESSLVYDDFSDKTREFLKKSTEYIQKKEMLEKMYAFDYFAIRDIFKEYNGTAYVRQVKTSGKA